MEANEKTPVQSPDGYERPKLNVLCDFESLTRGGGGHGVPDRQGSSKD